MQGGPFKRPEPARHHFTYPLPALDCSRCSLWKLDLPEGASTFNSVYGLIMLSGSVVLALVHFKVGHKGGCVARGCVGVGAPLHRLALLQLSVAFLRSPAAQPTLQLSIPYPPTPLQWMQNAVQMTNELVGAVNAEQQKQRAAAQTLAGGGGSGSGGSAKKKGGARREEKKRR